MNNNTKKITQNIFVYGMSGSGKDTISDFLKNTFDYQKIRLAHTIKQIICEKNGITFDELEERKRTEKELRDMHHQVSDYLGGEKTTLNRIDQIINKTSMDYHLIHKAQPIIICDVRSYNEAVAFLKAGWSGIFLKRTTTEYKNSAHYTEQHIFDNGQFEKICGLFDEKLIHTINNFDCDLNEFEKLSNNYKTDGSVRQLNQVLKQEIIPYIKKAVYECNK